MPSAGQLRNGLNPNNEARLDDILSLAVLSQAGAYLDSLPKLTTSFAKHSPSADRIIFFPLKPVGTISASLLWYEHSPTFIIYAFWGF